LELDDMTLIIKDDGSQSEITSNLSDFNALYTPCTEWWEEKPLGDCSRDQLEEIFESFAMSDELQSAANQYALQMYRSSQTFPKSVEVVLDQWRVNTEQDVPEALVERNRRDAIYRALREG
jgi:hypothetical protein